MSAFDVIASTYDDDFTYSAIGHYLRQRTHERLLTHYVPGAAVLEIGCGTGTDALALAAAGINVIATDASTSMLELTQRKTRNSPRISVQHLDLETLPAIPRHPEFSAEGFQQRPLDGAFANFGPLNCLSDWRPLAAWLARCVRPGGVVCFGIMGPWCVWEFVWHGAHLNFGVALRRLRGSRFQPEGSAAAVEVRYPSPRRISRDFAPYFRRIHLMPLGLFLPPSDVYPIIEKRPRLLRHLMHLEQRFGSAALFARFADHYWIELERTEF